MATLTLAKALPADVVEKLNKMRQPVAKPVIVKAKPVKKALPAPKKVEPPKAKPAPPPRPEPTPAELELRRAIRAKRDATDRKIQLSKACRAKLQELYPAVFSPLAPKPLAKGIGRAVKEAAGMAYSVTGPFLHHWTRRTEYLQAIAAGGHRYNLDKSESGEISDDDRAYASRTLAERAAQRAA